MKKYTMPERDAVKNNKETLNKSLVAKRGGGKGAPFAVKYVILGDDSCFEINGEMYWKETEVKGMLDLSADAIIELEEYKTINKELLNIYNKVIQENALLRDKIKTLKNLLNITG